LIPTLCCQEVLQGAANAREWTLLESYLSTQRMLRLDGRWQVHRDAASIFFDCRRNGHTPRSVVDCLIAQQVLDIDGVLLHEDRDYERIRAVRPLRTMTDDGLAAT
jgi:predicted nucleic acid-binding protein